MVRLSFDASPDTTSAVRLAEAHRPPSRRHGVSHMAASVPTAAPVTDRDGFLRAVRTANILTPAQLAKAKATAPGGAAPDLAAALVAAGLLTRFQADRLLSGRTDRFVLGPYVILDQIGRGTMSRVYKAKHRTMNRPVAIKVLSAQLTRTAAARQEFQREVRSAGKLAHPNIVTAYDANELHDRFYLVLEFVDGPSLDAFVHHRGPLPVAEACEFVRQVAFGLQHAHEKGMVHRDLKPQNLLVARPTPSAPLTVKIADFGIPKSGLGAVEFAAPEQLAPPGWSPDDARAAPEPIDHRADLYSLGCVFYFLLTGRPPFVGGTAEEKVRRHLWEAPAPLVQQRPDVPPEVAAIVHRLLAKSPGGRFASAAELILVLDSAFVPAAIPVEGVEALMNFDAPSFPVRPGPDSGYLTSVTPVNAPTPVTPATAAATVSPWEQIAEAAAGETLPLDASDTPTPSPYKPKSRGHGEPVPLWLSASLFVGITLLCLLGIGVVIKLMGH